MDMNRGVILENVPWDLGWFTPGNECTSWCEMLGV